MKNGTSKVSRTNLHLALLLLRKSPLVFGQSFCRVKNIVSPDRYLVLVVGCSCGSLLSLTLFCFQIFCCISCVWEIWMGSWGDPCQQWKLKASPSWSPESWITLKMDRYYSEEKESQSVYSDFSIILLCVDISATRRGDLLTPTNVFRKRKLSSRSVLFRPPKKKYGRGNESNPTT